MDKTMDIRDQNHLSGNDVEKLNFISSSGNYRFRKYYRSGLRSHIFEVIRATDLEKETQGVKIDGIRMFPRAEPIRMFRIFRQRFVDTETIFREIKKYKMLLQWIGKDFIAASQEFIVDYSLNGKSQILLCGLQEYIKGDILDPWRLFSADCVNAIFKAAGNEPAKIEALAATARNSIASFVKRIRVMVKQTGFIPDLAGNGNLIITPDGHLKLVDINNIVRIDFDDIIRIDDKGYPSCDVSIQVLAILEEVILGSSPDRNDPFYTKFLTPERKKNVKELERKFYEDLKASQ